MLEGCKGVVRYEDGLHLLEVGIAIKRSIATQQEVSDDSDGPDISVFRASVLHSIIQVFKGRRERTQASHAQFS